MGKKRKRRTHLRSKPVYPPGYAESLGGIISVTRVQALVRVLDTAIWMWVLERDPLAIHLLVMSQYQCLQDLCKRRGILPLAAMITDPEQRAVAYDFLRHASSSATAGLDFVPNVSGLFLYDAICTFEELFGGTTPLMKAFLSYFGFWFGQTYPQFGDAAYHDLPKGFTAEELLSHFNSLSRKAFFAKLTKAFREDAVEGSHIESP